VRFSISFLSALLIAVVLAAQAPSPPQQPTFRTTINFVRVDVYPTADGKPVPDLSKADFEILEDGVPQTVDTFEHVVIRPRTITSERVEPRSVEEGNRMAADARNRLFVLFLDTFHVTELSVMHSGELAMPGSTTTRVPPREGPIGTRSIRSALVNFLNRAVGPNDLFAAFTPDMDAKELSFTRRPDNFEDLTRTVWGRRFDWSNLDPEEERWRLCYPPDDPFNCYPGILQEMVQRRRENLTLGAARDLVARLGEIREERKAVLLVSEGWLLYRPDRQLARPLPEISNKTCTPQGPPGGKGIYVDGTIKSGTDPRTSMSVDWQQCESARVMLANLDNNRTYLDLADEANRNNTSFYPVDPRGLAAFATPYDYTDLPNTPSSMATLPPDKAPVADATDLRERLEALHGLATATDGTMTETNDLAGELKKIADDLSDYYLLGYYSTNAKTDGKFRRITVRVRRPGVAVRARRGYLALTEAEAAARKAAAARMDPEVIAREGALATLDVIRPDRPFHLDAGIAWLASPASSPPRPVVWVAGDLDISASRDKGWSGGGEASISLVTPDGKVVATQSAKLSATVRAFQMQMPTTIPAGDYVVRARMQGAAGVGAEASEQVRVTVPAGPPKAGSLGQAMLFRRGPYSGPGFQPTADLRFRRAERVRVDVPVTADVPSSAVTARVLDRNGQELAIPAVTGQREEAGLRLVSAEVTLAPLAAGDYLIEVSVRSGETENKVLTAIRVVR
jgi:VWFA-related protein